MKTFLITGASTGIGAATARLAVDAGFRVVLAARSKTRLDALVSELGGPERALAVQCDVTSFEEQQAMAERALEAFGSIDVAFANAGIGATALGTEKGDPDNWRDMVLTNVLGCAITCKVCLPELKRARGHVLITGSRAGRATLRGSIYGATKWATTGYAQNLREELKGTGVRVTLVAPGTVDTPFFDNPPLDALSDDDVARAVMYAVSQPASVNVSELQIAPTPPVE